MRFPTPNASVPTVLTCTQKVSVLAPRQNETAYDFEQRLRTTPLLAGIARATGYHYTIAAPLVLSFTSGIRMSRVYALPISLSQNVIGFLRAWRRGFARARTTHVSDRLSCATDGPSAAQQGKGRMA